MSSQTLTSADLNVEIIQQVIEKEVDEITEEDIASLISYFRKEREVFVMNEAAGKKAPSVKKLKVPSPATAEDVAAILGDL